VLGTTAFLSLYLTVPQELYPVTRLCAEPEAERFPSVLKNLQVVLKDYGGDVDFILTRRDNKTISTQICDTLSAGGLVTTNLDVLMGGGSRMVFPLFGGNVNQRVARVYLPALVGAAKTALRTGSTLLPWINLRTKTGFRLILEDPIGPVPCLGQSVPDDHPELLALCERLRIILERWIVQNPEQWTYWDRLHKRLVQET
ncbi:MAG: hypothetical protein V1754_15975, partial [Pseudomonadota bacterium]